jgi:hypothetical protein
MDLLSVVGRRWIEMGLSGSALERPVFSHSAQCRREARATQAVLMAVQCHRSTDPSHDQTLTVGNDTNAICIYVTSAQDRTQRQAAAFTFRFVAIPAATDVGETIC